MCGVTCGVTGRLVGCRVCVQEKNPEMCLRDMIEGTGNRFPMCGSGSTASVVQLVRTRGTLEADQVAGSSGDVVRLSETGGFESAQTLPSGEGGGGGELARADGICPFRFMHKSRNKG